MTVDQLFPNASLQQTAQNGSLKQNTSLQYKHQSPVKPIPQKKKLAAKKNVDKNVDKKVDTDVQNKRLEQALFKLRF